MSEPTAETQILEMNEATYDRVGEAIHETFSSVFSLSLEQVSIHTGPLRNPPRNISAFVVLRNPKAQGTFSIGFPHETALQIFSSFYGDKIEQIDERVIDGVGEVTNMVYGSLKKRLNEQGFDFEMFIPFIVLGNDFSHLKEAGAKSMVSIHFRSAAGDFWVEIIMTKTKPMRKVVEKAPHKKTTRKKSA